MKGMRKSFWINAGLLALMVMLLPIQGIAQQRGAESFRVQIATSVVGGGWMIVGEGLAEAVRREFPKSVVTVVPSSAPENPVRVHIGDVELSLSEVTTAMQAMRAEPPYKTKADKVRAIAGLFEGKFTFIITEETGIRSYADIKNKKYPVRVSTHMKGTLHELLIRAIFDGYGFKLEDIEKWGGKIYHLGFPDSSAMIKDGNLDAFLASSVIPHATIIELGTMRKIRHLPVDDNVAELVNKKYGTTRTVIPANAYAFEKADIPTIGSVLALITSSDLADDVAYSITRAFHRQIDYLRAFHSTLKDVSPKSLAEVGGLPLHPGAKRYYREAGIIKD